VKLKTRGSAVAAYSQEFSPAAEPAGRYLFEPSALALGPEAKAIGARQGGTGIGSALIFGTGIALRARRFL
jgi:hypothetical protein